MKFETVVVGPLAVNCYILYDENTKDCVVIDAGDDAPKIIKKLDSLGLKPKELWLTHGHFDHLGALTAIKNQYGSKVYLHEADYFMYKGANEHAMLFGCSVEAPPEAPSFFNMESAITKVGTSSIQILHTSGHSLGSVCFYSSDLKAVFSGDLIFDHSVGRTDVPGGSFEELETSIKQKIYTLNNDCVIYPGHGPKTNVGVEKKQNPFVKG